jgi:hypothetical protein
MTTRGWKIPKEVLWWCGVVLIQHRWSGRFSDIRQQQPVKSQRSLTGAVRLMGFFRPSLSLLGTDLVLAKKYTAKILYRKLEKIFPERKLRSLSPNFYILRSVCLFGCTKLVDRSWEYINRSELYEYGNWGQGRAVW